MKMAISKIKYMMERSFLKMLVPVCRKFGIVHALHMMSNVRERKRNGVQRKQFRLFYEKHKKEFERLSELLEDDFSRKTLQAVIRFRITWKNSAIKNIVVKPQYFPGDILKAAGQEIFIDGGAYVGDTAIEFIRKFAGGGYKRIYLWEPDETNRIQIKKNLKHYRDIVMIPYGMWKEKAELCFAQNGNAGSQIAETGSEKISVDSIDNLHLGERVTFIKMDIEGSETEALQGAKNVICKDKPKLAICLYHRPEDLYTIPFMIKEMVPDYKLYIRHHSDTYAETVVYATL